MTLVRFRDWSNLQKVSNQDTNEAKGAVIKYIEGELKSNFELLAPHLIESKRENRYSTDAIEVDKDKRFFRLFVAFEVSVSSHLYNVPVIGFDGTHSHHHKFNGVIISLIGRYGIGQNVM